MPSSFRHKRRVQFAETDLAGIVHFSCFYRYMEETEHAFFRSLGLTVHDAEAGWPRVNASCDFKLPLKFEEVFEVELLVARIGGSSMTYAFRFWKDPDGERTLAATGEIVAVCVRMDAEAGRMKATKIPQRFLDKIEQASENELSL